MKQLFIILLSLTVFSSCESTTSKYKEGDIVYLKPDSTKAVMVIIRSSGRYQIDYMDSLKVRHTIIVLEHEIY